MVFIAIAKLGLMQFYVFTGIFLTVDPQCRKLINVRVGCVCVCVHVCAWHICPNYNQRHSGENTNKMISSNIGNERSDI